MSKNSSESKKERRPKRPFPKDSLKEALVIAKAIQEQNAGKPMKRIFVADAISRKPESSDFTYLLSSSFRYGLTLGSEKAEYIELAPIGQSVTKPLTEEERISALQQAALKPELFKRVYEHYRDAKLPSGDFFRNVIEREFGVPREWVDDCIRILVDNGWFANIIKEVSGAPHIVFEAVPTAPVAPAEGVTEKELLPAERPPQAVPIVNQIFVGHGKNKVPLEQMKKILTEFKVPFKVAVDEPHKGRPISKKVADLMKSCMSAIFIFTADEEYTNAEGTKTFRPSDNVVYELGAASVLYENKIVIFKEDGVTFASDFSDLGYIPFEKDKIDAKAMDLLKELVGLGFLKIMPA